MILVLLQYGTQGGTTGSQDVHGVRICRNALEDVLNRRGKPAQRLELAFIPRQFGDGGQLSVNQQIRNLFELGLLREIQDVVTAIVKVVTQEADRTQRRVAGGNAGQRNGFLRLGRSCSGFIHFWLPFSFPCANSSSSLFSYSW